MKCELCKKRESTTNDIMVKPDGIHRKPVAICYECHPKLMKINKANRK